MLPEKLQYVVGTAYDRVYRFSKEKSATLFQAVFKKKIGRSLKSARLPHKEMLIHGDAQNRIFHLPGCANYDCTHCTLKFKDINIATKAGFTPCNYCKSQLDKF